MATTPNRWQGFDSWVESFDEDYTEEQERLEKVIRTYPIRPLTAQEKAELLLQLGITDTRR